MAWYRRFGSTILPTNRPQQFNGRTARPRLLAVVNGVVDTYGANDAIIEGGSIRVQGFLLVADGSIESQLRSLKARVGQRDRLWRLTEAGGWEWVYARLISCENNRQVAQWNHLAVQMVFETVATKWNGLAHGFVWQFNDGVSQINAGLSINAQAEVHSVNGGSAQDITISNDGDVTVNDCIVTFTAGQETTTLTITVNGDGFVYLGTVSAGDSLVVDCGKMTVLNDGTGDYANFAPPSTRPHWLPLASGDNTVSVFPVYSSGSTASSIQFSFYDGWS